MYTMDYPAATEAVAPTPKLDASLRPYHPAPGTDAAPAVPAVSLSVAKAAGDLASHRLVDGQVYSLVPLIVGSTVTPGRSSATPFLEGQQRTLR